MTEREWEACADPRKMLAFLRSRKTGLTKAGRRKLRLYACACCRGIWHLVADERSRRAVEVAERHADGGATAEQLWEAAVAAGKAADALSGRPATAAHHGRMAACAAATRYITLKWGAALAATEAALARQKAAGRGRTDAWTASQVQPEERRWLADLLRCLYGNPFRPVSAEAAWLSWNDGAIPKLARLTYEERAFDRLPILADALEEAGCADADILSHCRGPGPHARGCFVLDLVLGKR